MGGKLAKAVTVLGLLSSPVSSQVQIMATNHGQFKQVFADGQQIQNNTLVIPNIPGPGAISQKILISKEDSSENYVAFGDILSDGQSVKCRVKDANSSMTISNYRGITFLDIYPESPVPPSRPFDNEDRIEQEECPRLRN